MCVIILPILTAFV